MNKIFILFLALFADLAQAMQIDLSSLSNKELKEYVKSKLDRKIKKFFQSSKPELHSFDAVKIYIKNGTLSHGARHNGRNAIEYHCRYDGCTRVGKSNVADVASCYLTHYANNFFSCPGCSFEYKLSSSLMSHILLCKKLDVSFESDESCDHSESEESNESASKSDSDYIDRMSLTDITINNYESRSDEEQIDFDLGILDSQTVQLLPSIHFPEELEISGVDPKLIFNVRHLD
ncbi:hypothetical protein Noda2021_01310 [Candidatus Dependentiae bacterium Noda2021]|nr:hypothetical protein Noda2021_01310 [Candidatus Dependentiae bacterium Noda2021]